MNIFFATRANVNSNKHFIETIEKGIELSSIEDLIENDLKELFKNQDKIRVWGVPDTLKSTWDKMDKGDVVFFYKNKYFANVGEVYEKYYSSELANELWPDEENESACIYFLKNIQNIKISIEVINKLAAYEKNNVFGAFQVLKKEATNKILAEYGSIENFIKNNEENSDFKKLVNENDLVSNNLLNILENKKQIIIYGPPGTGKTYITKNISFQLIHNELEIK